MRPAVKAKICSACRAPYVGGFRSHRCPRCQRIANDGAVARAQQAQRIRDGRAPSPALQRRIDFADFLPPVPAPAAAPRVARAQDDRSSVWIAAAIARRLHAAAKRAGVTQFAMVRRILDGWAPTSPAPTRSAS